MLLHKQVFEKQCAACAQNETATIKCLWPDVHQSVVFEKILNKSNRAISGKTGKRKSYSTMRPVRKKKKKGEGGVGHPVFVMQR